MSPRRSRGAACALLALVLTAAGAIGAACSAPTLTNDPPGSAPRQDVHPGLDGGAGPCEPGTTHECHAKLAEHDGVLTCVLGTATCQDDGTYGPCEGSFVSRRTSPSSAAAAHRSDAIAPTPGALQQAPGAVLYSLTDAGACQNDPCDPSCAVFDEDPPDAIAPDAAPTGSYQGGSISSIPSGFIGKGIIEPCSQTSDCQFDEHCVSGDCVPWEPGETDPNCAGIDLTAGVPCSGTVPICNRGNTAVDAGVTVYVYAANEPKFPLCNPDTTSPSVKGSCTVSVPIPAGACVDITDADCVKWGGGGSILSGNKTVMVNPPIAGAASECTCENNWSDYHSGGCDSQSIYQYEPMTYTQTYTASCPDGTNVQWGLLTYTTSTPGDSNVVFQVHTADSAANLGNPLYTAATAEATPTDTQVCQVGDPGCPIDLYTVLGGPPAAIQPVLELVMTLNPTSDKSAAPTVDNWSITYSCPYSQ